MCIYIYIYICEYTNNVYDPMCEFQHIFRGGFPQLQSGGILYTFDQCFMLNPCINTIHLFGLLGGYKLTKLTQPNVFGVH